MQYVTAATVGVGIGLWDRALSPFGGALCGAVIIPAYLAVGCVAREGLGCVISDRDVKMFSATVSTVGVLSYAVSMITDCSYMTSAGLVLSSMVIDLMGKRKQRS